MFHRVGFVLRQQRSIPSWKREGNTASRALRRKELLSRAGAFNDHQPLKRDEVLSDPSGSLQTSRGSGVDRVRQAGAHAVQSMSAPWQLPTVSPVHETPKQANLRGAIQHANTWEDALTLFSQTTTHGVQPTPRMFATLAATLMERRAQAIKSSTTLSVASLLDDARSSTSERWEVTPQERRDLARYVLREVNREAASSEVAYDGLVGAFTEGPDNGFVTLLEASMRRHRTVPGMDALADFASLKVNWQTSLRLMRLAREAHGVFPITELYERTMQLAVGSGKTSFGTRPWKLALSLYEECVTSGNEITNELHTRALQALWRSSHRTWLSNHDQVDPVQAAVVWSSALQVIQRAQEGRVRGHEGSRLYEAAVQALMHSSHWEGALAIVGSMELAESDTTSTLLIPTPTTLAECVSGMLRVGNHFQAQQFADLFESYHYEWRTLPAEVLRVLLSMCRIALRNSFVPLPRRLLGSVLRTDEQPTSSSSPLLLERSVAIECLHLLTRRRLGMESPTARWTSALRLVGAYDANLWPQNPLERKNELSLVFQAIRRIATVCTERAQRRSVAGEDQMSLQHPVEKHVGVWIRGIFGRSSAEYEWWQNSLVHKLHTLPHGMPWEQGLVVLNRVLSNRKRGEVSTRLTFAQCGVARNLRYLPVPYRQLLLMVAVNSWRALDSRTSLFVEDEDLNDDSDDQVTASPMDAAVWKGKIDAAVHFISHTLYSASALLHDACTPWWLVGFLKMLQARLTHDTGDAAAAKVCAEQALDALGRAPVGASRKLSSAVVIDAVIALKMPTEQTEMMVNDTHYILRRNALLRSAASPGETRYRAETFHW
ncbi:Hypothetical protein, putative [Bodo saltans]|uniref:Uncharacterized protein n=1 Tax=Bodo saltans TaxID=75058 RepID=A0A0S4JKX7_BODSA|nr:Hypothetical protein, putative [Bodo saltans]|eukprot:CUG90845.1 Hypothetical protein, putative [Bodo saltans]